MCFFRVVVARGLQCQLAQHAPTHVTRAAAAIVFLLAGIPDARVGDMPVAVRWTGDDASIAGYRLYVRPAGGAERAPIDVPRPRHDGSGRFETVVDDLDVETTYTFAISAYREDGTESDRSNSYTIGYAQAAAIVDSDHDGLTDAEEDRNLNLRLDAGESDRLVADSDGDDVPDGLERDFGSDPLDGIRRAALRSTSPRSESSATAPPTSASTPSSATWPS